MRSLSRKAPAVLLANDPLAYRQALARVFQTQRPDLHVVTVTQEHLDAAVRNHAPLLVICDRLTDLVETSVGAWIELYPAGARRVTSSFGGTRSISSDLDLAALLAFLDRAESTATG